MAFGRAKTLKNTFCFVLLYLCRYFQGRILLNLPSDRSIDCLFFRVLLRVGTRQYYWFTMALLKTVKSNTDPSASQATLKDMVKYVNPIRTDTNKPKPNGTKTKLCAYHMGHTCHPIFGSETDYPLQDRLKMAFMSDHKSCISNGPYEKDRSPWCWFIPKSTPSHPNRIEFIYI